MSQDDSAGIIGTEILRRLRVILDYPGQRMIFEPNVAFSAPSEFDMSGSLSLTREHLAPSFARFTTSSRAHPSAG